MALEALAAEADATLLVYSKGLNHSSLHRRIDVLNDLAEWLRSAPQSAEPISKPQTRVLVRLLLRAICNPQYLERSWIKGLYNAIASATKSERCPMFTPVCVVNLSGE